MFRVLVTGGRFYKDCRHVFEELEDLLATYGEIHVVHGACCTKESPQSLRGADRWAQEWAQVNQMPYTGIPARWMQYGKAAGAMRNRQMAKLRIDLVLAFPGGTGTSNMVDEATQAGIRVRVLFAR